MKLEAVAWVVSIALAGCSWNDFWSQFDHGHRGSGHGSSSGNNRAPGAPTASGTDAIRMFEGAIAHSPPPKVSLVTYQSGDQQERGVRAELAEGQAVNLSGADPQDIERALQDGTLSLLDLLLIARAIKSAGYRLAASQGADGDLVGGVGGGGATDEQVAKAVHDRLLQIVRTHAADCQALCAGDPSECGSRRSFGGGAPCAIAGQTQDKISGHFGAGWCVSDFCPALIQARE